MATERETLTDDLDFLQGGGEMGKLTRAYDWAKTPVGVPEHWPQNLRITVSLILSSKFPMFLWWGNELIQFYNDAYRPSLGNNGKHPNALGQRGKECWPEIWEIIFPLIQQVRTTGEATWSEDQLVPIFRNGKIEDVYWTFGYSAIKGCNGRVDGVLVVCNETTEKILAKKKIEESRQRLIESEMNLRNTIVQAPVAMCILRGKTFVVELANKLMYDLWGHEEGNVVNRPIFEALPEVKNQGFEELLHNVFTKGVSHKADAVPVTLKRGPGIGVVYCDFLYHPYYDLEGRISGVLAVAVDVTHQVHAKNKIEELVDERTRQLALTNLKLEQSNSELAQFAYIASHDLQEPVRKISTFAQLLERSLGQMDEKSKSYLDKIMNSSTRMITLIRDVLGYSQLSREAEAKQEVSLKNIVNEVISDYELMVEQKKAVIRTNELPVIKAIPLQMTQLFGNLLSNSLKYCREDVPPVVTILSREPNEQENIKYNLAKDRRYQVIEFSDNGIGFRQEYTDRIFNIFQRLHGKTDYAGTGIGLATCRKIVENHHGVIYARGGDSGATFVVILPDDQK